MKSIKVILLLSLISPLGIIITNCGGGGGRGTTVTPYVPGAVSGGARVAGKLVDASGNPIAGASITVIGVASNATTDGNGNFFVNTTASEQGTPVRIVARRAGYVEGFYTVRVSPDTVVNGQHDVTLTMLHLPTAAADATQATVTNADGSTQAVTPTAVSEGGATYYLPSVTLSGAEQSVVFTTPAANGTMPDVSFQIGSAAGANATTVLGQAGSIKCSVTYGSPTDAEDLKTFPGEFTTTSDVGDGRQGHSLITAGFARINLSDANGQPITRFADGQTAKITMKIPTDTFNSETGALITAGDTVPIFVFNETTGEWIVERNADNTIKRATVQESVAGDLFVEFETSHLSTFNLDYFSSMCSEWGQNTSDTPIVNIVDVQGNPVTGASLYFSAPSGWSHYGFTAPDNKVTLWRAPRSIPWQIYATKDNIKSETLTVQSCKETKSGKSEFNLVINKGECTSDAKCDDNNPATTDKCTAPNTNYSVCTHTQCNPLCSTNTQCDDSKPATTDTCVYGGSCQAFCSHTSCTPGCSSDAQCDDNNPETLNTCLLPGTCNAVCQNPAAYCDIQLDSQNYIPGDTMTITLTGRNDGAVAADCGVAAALKNQAGSEVWNSFSENLFITIQPGQTVTRTITKVVPGTWPGTNTNAGSDYSMYSVHNSGERWNKGENFNIHVSKTCAIACTGDVACNDGSSLTTDVCNSPGTCNSFCTHTACTPACFNDAACSDGNNLTLDTCNNAGTCSASCTHTACTPSCFNDAACDDGNPATPVHTCQNPGTCSAVCNSAPPCSIACTNNSQCDDSNALTNDACNNPNTCNAACSHTACTIACSNNAACDDSNPLTTDACNNPGTCSAVCSNTSCTPACTNDTQCDDSNALTLDTCNNLGTCSAACSHTTCTPTCSNDAACDDSNALTIDACLSPGTCSAACTHTACTPACANDAACNDTNPLTIDACLNPGACNASCTNTPFTPACSSDAECNDGNPATTDYCVNPGTPTAACYNNTLLASVDSTTPTRVSGTATVTLTCTNSGTVTSLEGRCNTTDAWATIASGNTKSCVYNALGTYTPGCRINGTMTNNVASTVNVLNHLPSVTASGSPLLSANAPFDVTFTGGCSDTDGSCVSYLWDFGDGTPTSNLQNPVHTYIVVGIYIITLTVTDSDGATAQATLISGTVNNKKISGGYWYTCAVTTSGGVKCWGDNANGKLGDGTTTRRLTAVDVVGLTSGVVAIAAGNSHTCALTSVGGVKCWGGNNSGQLGDGTTTSRTTPVYVAGLTSGVVDISMDADHSCALTDTGSVKCWGKNILGELGDGTTMNRLSPVDVSGLSSGVRSISAGGWLAGGHSCALTVTGGLKCWGRNMYGQLADGTTVNRLTPVDVSGLLSNVTSVSVGHSGGPQQGEFTCALTSAGGVKCWGENLHYQLGNSAPDNQLTPLDVSGATTSVAGISTGGNHACILTTAGGVKCWGNNVQGELGDNTLIDSAFPVNVTGLSSGVTAISAGGFHNCAFVTSGVKCWGSNVAGELGNGTTTNSLTPVDVIGF